MLIGQSPTPMRVGQTYFIYYESVNQSWRVTFDGAKRLIKRGSAYSGYIGNTWYPYISFNSISADTSLRSRWYTTNDVIQTCGLVKMRYGTTNISYYEATGIILPVYAGV